MSRGRQDSLDLLCVCLCVSVDGLKNYYDHMIFCLAGSRSSSQLKPKQQDARATTSTEGKQYYLHVLTLGGMLVWEDQH